MATLCCCAGSRTGTLTGDARDRELLKAATADYLQAKYLPNLLGARRRSLFTQAKTLLTEVLNDDAASLKSKQEAADMLDNVNSRLESVSN